MNIPQLPFDNLYKFLAITGYMIMILPTLYLNNEVDDTTISIAEISAEVQYLKSKGEISDTLVLRKKLAVQEALTKQQDAKIKWLYFFVIFGAIIGHWGLLAWYNKVQVPKDIILKKQAEQISNGNS
ncbi:MAG: hypothetical protein OQK75_03735 [Gammaproteobacteria bacterium]|nr:hypothetical protein [Gammaproteobacteria bacterium]MCW8986759.1 hypothetical protein [Gammaproteobacteria bacterium]